MMCCFINFHLCTLMTNTSHKFCATKQSRRLFLLLWARVCAHLQIGMRIASNVQKLTKSTFRRIKINKFKRTKNCIPMRRPPHEVSSSKQKETFKFVILLYALLESILWLLLFSSFHKNHSKCFEQVVCGIHTSNVIRQKNMHMILIVDVCQECWRWALICLMTT